MVNQKFTRHQDHKDETNNIPYPQELAFCEQSQRCPWVAPVPLDVSHTAKGIVQRRQRCRLPICVFSRVCVSGTFSKKTDLDGWVEFCGGRRGSTEREVWPRVVSTLTQNHGRARDVRGELELEAPELRVSTVKGQEMKLKWSSGIW